MICKLSIVIALGITWDDCEDDDDDDDCINLSYIFWMGRYHQKHFSSGEFSMTCVVASF